MPLSDTATTCSRHPCWYQVDYDGVYEPKSPYTFTHPRPQRQSSLRIYETHVGIAGMDRSRTGTGQGIIHIAYIVHIVYIVDNVYNVYNVYDVYNVRTAYNVYNVYIVYNTLYTL